MGRRATVQGSGVGTLARRIRERREQLGLTQDRLAQRMGVCSPRVSDLERGVSKDPKLSTLRRLAKVLETTVGGLLGDPPIYGYSRLPTTPIPCPPPFSSSRPV